MGSTCDICGSRFHWASNCPDKRKGNIFEINTIELFQTDYEDKYKLKELVSDTFDAVVLDSAATKTAAGISWIENYVSKLPEEVKNQLQHKPTSSMYKFGDGETVPASYSITIPAEIGDRKVSIDIDVIDKDIPCLLSRQSMKQMNTQL